MDSQFNLLEAIEYINPEDLTYQEWVNVGMALQHEGYGVNVWDNWSARRFCKISFRRVQPEVAQLSWQ